MPFDPPPTESPESLTERLAAELAERWRAGERPLAEEYLQRHPDLWQDPAAAADLILEEILRRQERGEPNASREVVARFPQWQTQLQVLLQCHRALETGLAVPRYPEPGDTVDQFRLLCELGRGGQGRVFLALQPALADRPVVLKLNPLTGSEHLSLARLQHTHIVPLYGVHDLPEFRLRALCMPYFGGTTLDRLLDLLENRPIDQRTGALLLEVLDRAQRSRPLQLPVDEAARQRLQGASYVQAVCGIVACLADALHYAHERGLIHLDIKPANVLLTADAQPMLLDFHLAHEALRAGAAPPEWLGGTPGYTSPEQLAGLNAVTRAQPVPHDIDGRSDIYSLGLLLAEALAASVSDTGETVRFSTNKDIVSTGLQDIVRKCLAHDPRRRYADAAALADDLRRHLQDLPLRGVGNRSLGERWQKWRRRRPQVLFALVLSMLVLGAIAFAFHFRQAQDQQRRSQVEELLADAQHALEQGRPADALRRLGQAAPLASQLHDGPDLVERIRTQIDAARRAQASGALHRVVDRLRVLYGSDLSATPSARSLETQCRSLWEKRGKLLDGAGALAQTGARRQLDLDFLDLAILSSDMRERLARRDERPIVRGEVLQVLDEAERQFGPSPVLEYERQRLAHALGLQVLADKAERRRLELTPRSAWDHYALGRALLRDGSIDQASSALRQAVALQPQDLWANFYQGLCAYRAGQHQDALVAFTTCSALAPDVAGCYHNRALVYEALGRPDRALQDYDRAVQLEPSFTPSRLQRGVLHFHEKRWSLARADFEAAAAQGADGALVCYNIALVDLAQGDQAGARRRLRQVLQHDPEHKDARRLLAEK